MEGGTCKRLEREGGGRERVVGREGGGRAGGRAGSLIPRSSLMELLYDL